MAPLGGGNNGDTGGGGSTNGTSGGAQVTAGMPNNSAGGQAAGGSDNSAGESPSSAGAAGEAAPPPSCTPTSCATSARCVETETGVSCVCDGALVPEKLGCRTPVSCDELHQSAPSLPSGVYSIQPTPASNAVSVYCEMQESGGGWTLILNEGTHFVPIMPGTDDAICYEQNCTSSVYSTLPLARDVLLDVANEDISGQNYLARVRILGVHSASRGKTLREMFTAGPYFLEREDNSNVTVTIPSGATCGDTLPLDFAALVCDSCSSSDQTCGKPIVTLGDADSACNASLMFAIGGSTSESESWTNCAGWPQGAFLTDSASNIFQYYPSNVRVWLR